METWKDIPGYESLYKISDQGNVKSLSRKGFYDRKPNVIINYKEKILKSISTGNGYLAVLLYKNKKCKKHRVHILAAKTFIDNPENKSEVNHKDENRSNNNISNLEWVTRKENVYHSKKITKSAAVISVKKIRQLYGTHKGSIDDFVSILIENSK